jgi:hypothetical protein
MMAAVGTQKDTKPVFLPVHVFLLLLESCLASSDINGMYTG